MSVTYIVRRVDVEEGRWPRDLSRVGSGGREEVCLSCLCAQVSHQAWGLGLKGQGMVTKHLLCEGHQMLVVVEIHTTAVGRQKPRSRCCLCPRREMVTRSYSLTS